MATLRAAAETFEVRPRCGAEGRSVTHARISRVVHPLKTTLTLLDDGRVRLCLVTSHFITEHYPFSNLLRDRVADAAGIPREQVFSFSAHNHTDALLMSRTVEHGIPRCDERVEERQLTREGRALLSGAERAATHLARRLQPVTVRWAIGHERRITYNRKGVRADGSTYFMREEDRLRLGGDFNGDIDDEAPVVAFVGADGRPVCFLVQFTGHPTTAYHPEFPIVHGDYPQVASDDLSRAFGGVPVGFLQGCAGNHNSKGLLSGRSLARKASDATRYGHWLGATYVRAAERLRPSAGSDLGFSWRCVRMPFKAVPSERVLRRQIAEMTDFIGRCERAEPDTLSCVGMNVSRNMSHGYRAALIRPILRWAQWALRFHTQNRLARAPTHVDLLMGAIRIGDVGIVGMPCEPFSGIGLQVKRRSPLPLAIPCGYMNSNAVAYVPDAGNNGDLDYVSSFYRFTTSMLAYRQPAGDLLARAGVEMLRKLSGVGGRLRALRRDPQPLTEQDRFRRRRILLWPCAST